MSLPLDARMQHFLSVDMTHQLSMQFVDVVASIAPPKNMFAGSSGNSCNFGS
jgi:hypothetical protein